MRIGVYVGSFDPFHKGHEDITNYILNNNYVDKVIIIPTLSYWDKSIKTTLEDRIKMIKLLESERIEVNCDLNNYQYTYEIMNELKKRYNNSSLYLVIGADSLISFNKWKEVNKILKNNILVIPRNNIAVYKYINEYSEKNKFIIVSDFKKRDVSSTMIRDKLINKKYHELNKYMNNKIIQYIINNNLYISK